MATNNISWVKECPDYPTPAPDSFQVPKSCCVKFGDKETDCRKNPLKSDYALKGCITKLEDTFDSNKNVILAVGVTVVVIMVSNI